MDGPRVATGRLAGAAASFTETPALAQPEVPAPALAGHCGAYWLRASTSGWLPRLGMLRVRFPPGVQLNDRSCFET